MIRSAWIVLFMIIWIIDDEIDESHYSHENNEKLIG